MRIFKIVEEKKGEIWAARQRGENLFVLILYKYTQVFFFIFVTIAPRHSTSAVAACVIFKLRNKS